MSELNLDLLGRGFNETDDAVPETTVPATTSVEPESETKTAPPPSEVPDAGSRRLQPASPNTGPRPAPKHPSPKFPTVASVATAFLAGETLDVGRCKQIDGVMHRDCIVQANAPWLCQSPMLRLEGMTALVRPGRNDSVNDPDAAFIGFCKTCTQKARTAENPDDRVVFSAFSVQTTIERQAQARCNAAATAGSRPDRGRDVAFPPRRSPPDPNKEQTCSATKERGIPHHLTDGVPEEADLSKYPDEASKKKQMDAWDAKRVDILRVHGVDGLSDKLLRHSEDAKLRSRNCHLHGHVFRRLGHVMHQLFGYRPNWVAQAPSTNGRPLSAKAKRNAQTRAERDRKRADRSAADHARWDATH